MEAIRKDGVGPSGAGVPEVGEQPDVGSEKELVSLGRAASALSAMPSSYCMN